MRVAAVQFAPAFKNKGANLLTMEDMARRAASSGAKLVVFPELATTGYSLMSVAEARSLAEPLTAEAQTFGTMQRLSKDLGVCIAWGMVEASAGSGELYNSQVLVTSDGRWSSYSKINRWGNDFLWSSGGRSNPTILEVTHDGESKRLGLLICRDVRDKKDDQWKSFYEKGDADVVVMSANWGDGGFPAVAWMDFVRENDMALVVANRYGREANNNFGEGGVCIINPPDKVTCAGLAWNRDCIVYGDV